MKSIPKADPNITAEVICDSVNQFTGDRITTMIVQMPRIILAEIMMHRQLARSSASTRAIPVEKQIQKVRDNPFIPSWWGRAQKGMAAFSQFEPHEIAELKELWFEASRDAIEVAELFKKMGLHKQISNRVIEPFTYVRTLITATEWDNLYSLRCHHMAQPEFQVAAYRMLEAHVESTPQVTNLHLPFGDRMDPGLFEEDRIKISVARCARLSYDTFEGEINHKEDIRLYESLLADRHMGPFEHPARAFPRSVFIGPFRGWAQHRKTIDRECVNKIDRQALLATKPDWI